MNTYILASAIVLAGGAVAAAYFLSNSVRRASQAVPDTLVGVTGKAVDGATTVVQTAAETAEHLIQPISNAVGKLGESLADRLRTRQEELTALRGQVLTLTQEIESLKSRRISIDEVRTILQLALLEAGFTRYNIKKLRIGGEDGGFLSRNEETEYLGIIKASYKQRLGVDLDKLKFQVVSPREIAVLGLGQTEIIGTLAIDIEPFHTELRRHLTGGKVRGNVSEIVRGDPDGKAIAEERKQNQEIIREINEDKTTKEIDDAIEKMALSFLRVCFAPAGYQVVRATGALENPKSFQVIGAELNGRVEQLIHERTEALQSASRKCLLTEGKMGELIDSSAGEMKAAVIRAGRDLTRAS